MGDEADYLDDGGHYAMMDYFADCCEDANGECENCDARDECNESSYRRKRRRQSRKRSR